MGLRERPLARRRSPITDGSLERPDARRIAPRHWMSSVSRSLV